MSQNGHGMGLFTDDADTADGALVRRVLAGEVEAYAGLVERYREEFGRYAASLCRDEDIAADAMQEAFIRAFERLESCRDPDRFGAWFFRILTNQCHNHRDRRRKHVALDTVAVAGPERTDRRVTQEEIRALIDRALDQLTPDLRETFVLREIDGRSYAEIAGLLETNEAALRKRVERAREMVRTALEEWL